MSAFVPLLERVEQHLRDVIRAPETKIDANLIEELQGLAGGSLQQDQKRTLINLVAQLLQNVQQNPEPVTRLAESLVQSFSFSEVQKIDPPVDLVAGLRVPSPPVQLLTLRLISLAIKSSGDIATVAGSLDLVKTLVETWLQVANIAVAERAGDVLRSLLSSETAPPSMPSLMQRRLFKDKDVYELFFSLPSLKTVGQAGQPSKKDKTIAQGRLLGFLEGVWQFDDVWQSQNSSIEKFYGLSSNEGLMQFASLHMIDESDVLLRRTQFDFFAALLRGPDSALSSRRSRDSEDKSLEHSIAVERGLSFLISSGIHERTISLYSNPEIHDPVDASFLRSSAATYTAAYLTHHRDHFMNSEATRKNILHRLVKSIGETQNSQWARNDGPSDDLNVLVSLPPPVLVQDSSCLLDLPTRPSSADVFRCLGIIFSGRAMESRSTEIVFPVQEPRVAPQTSRTQTDAAQALNSWASRCLYVRYTAKHPSFWADLIVASGAAAIRDTAIAAIELMTSIIRADWLTELPADVGAASTNLSQQAIPESSPDTGLAVVLHPSVLDLVVPFLMRGPSENRGVGLLGTDTESAEYHVARAKLKMTRALKEGIEEMVKGLQGGGDEQVVLMELAAGLGALLRQGMGKRENEPGTEVGTMEL